MNDHQILLFPFQSRRGRPGFGGDFEEVDKVLEGLFVFFGIFCHGILGNRPHNL